MLMDSAVHRIPVLAETGIRKLYNGPGELHARQPVPDGRGPGGPRLLRRRRLQLRRDRVRGRRRTSARRVGRRGRADQRPGVGRHPTLRAVPEQRPVPARAGGGDARPALRPAVAEPRARDRAAVPPLAGARPARGARRGARQQDGLGAGQRLRSRGRDPVARLHLGQATVAAVVRGRAARHPPRRRRLRPDLLLEVRRHRPRRRGVAAVALHGRRLRSRRVGHLHRAAEPARHLRVGPHRHPGRRRASSCWSAARRPRCATSTGSGVTSRPATTPGWST